MELVIVTVLFAILVPVSVGIFISGRKITGQGYIQHQAALTLGENNDILRYLRNLGYDQLSNGSFYLIRNPGAGSWLVKSDLPEKELFERFINVSDALRHQGTNHLYFDGDTGAFYADPDTKKVVIDILWAPDYLHSDIISQTIYISDWKKVVVYDS